MYQVAHDVDKKQIYIVFINPQQEKDWVFAMIFSLSTHQVF